MWSFFYHGRALLSVLFSQEGTQILQELLRVGDKQDVKQKELDKHTPNQGKQQRSMDRFFNSQGKSLFHKGNCGTYKYLKAP